MTNPGAVTPHRGLSIRYRRLVAVAGLGAAALLAVPMAAVAAGSPPPATAPGAPGAASFFDLARKDCVGTARNTTSKVWFTVADGVLSDVYEPTIDDTNVKSFAACGDRWLVVHGLANARPHVHGGDRSDRDELHDHREQRGARLSTGHDLCRGRGSRRGAHAHAAAGACRHQYQHQQTPRVRIPGRALQR